jgi:hypothetical protein
MNIDRSLQNLGSYLILFHFSNNLCASAPLREKESSISFFRWGLSLNDPKECPFQKTALTRPRLRK